MTHKRIEAIDKLNPVFDLPLKALSILSRPIKIVIAPISEPKPY